MEVLNELCRGATFGDDRIRYVEADRSPNAPPNATGLPTVSIRWMPPHPGLLSGNSVRFVDGDRSKMVVLEDLADEVTRDWRKSLKLTQSIIEEGIQRGELLPIDAWQVAQSFSNLANSLIEQDSKRHRRLIRSRPLHETYKFSIELLLMGILVDRSRSKIVSDADYLAD